MPVATVGKVDEVDDLDLRVAADGNEAKWTIKYSSDTVGVRFVDFSDNGAAFPHVNAAIELARHGLTRGEKGDAQDLLRGSHFAEEAVGSFKSISVPKFGVFVANGYKFVARRVRVEAARVHIGHVSIGLAQGNTGSPVIQN
jgi:hypothetical protein